MAGCKLSKSSVTEADQSSENPAMARTTANASRANVYPSGTLRTRCRRFAGYSPTPKERSTVRGWNDVESEVCRLLAKPHLRSAHGLLF